MEKTLGDCVRIAVIDNGIDVTHPDLTPGIIGGGYFEDDGIGSATFVAYVAGDPSFPSGNHGTFCLGMAGARWSNGVAGVGGAPRSGLVPIVCLADQIGSQSTLARAVAYAANPRLEDATAPEDSGAHVVSCSLGPNAGAFHMTSVLRDAIDYAVGNGRGGKGTPVFWAVSNGNEPVSLDDVCSYANTIAVGRSSRMDLQDGSAFGPELDFLAPGVAVYSTRAGGGFGQGTGTSYATPCAASVGGLVVAREDEPDLPEPVVMAPIFRTAEGQWWIGTDKITVRLSDEVSDERAEEILREACLEVLRKLGFGRNLFEVRVTGGHEALSVAGTLCGKTEVEYAEPQFIERLGSR